MQLKKNFLEAEQILSKFNSEPANFIKIEEAVKLIFNSVSNGGKVISCGNGGSMCDAMHFAEELSGRFRNDRKPIAALSISDPSHISCVGNDYGYEFIFSRYVEAVATKGDVLLAISTSGNSKNVINAIEVAKSKGMIVIGLSGNNGGQMADLCDIEIRAPYSEYADRAQEIHIKIIHSLIHGIEEMFGY